MSALNPNLRETFGGTEIETLRSLFDCLAVACVVPYASCGWAQVQESYAKTALHQWVPAQLACLLACLVVLCTTTRFPSPSPAHSICCHCTLLNRRIDLTTNNRGL